MHLFFKKTLVPSGFALCGLILSGCGASEQNEPVSSSASVAPVFGIINDTGRQLCASSSQNNLPCDESDLPAQDAEFGRDKAAAMGTLMKVGGGDAGFDFSRLGNDGMPLLIQDGQWDANGSEDSGSLWACVRDNVTQLTWEVKHDSPSHPQYALHTYSWYNSRAEENGGLAGFMDLGDCTEGRCDTEGYVSYINSIKLCGYSDWRMPTVSELHGIGNLGQANPAIDSEYFPDTLGGLRYWTASPVASVAQLAWYVYFSDASISFTDKSNRSYVRLVRSPLGQ